MAAGMVSECIASSWRTEGVNCMVVLA